MSIYYNLDLQDLVGRHIEIEDLSKRLRQILFERGFERCRVAMQETAIFMRNFMIEEMRNSPGDPSRPYYPTKSSRKRTKAHLDGKPSFRSFPGNPPRPDTGALVGSIGVDDRWDEVEIGSLISKLENRHGKALNWKYPEFLETGTARMAARPWLAPALVAGRRIVAPAIGKILQDVSNHLGGR